MTGRERCGERPKEEEQGQIDCEALAHPVDSMEGRLHEGGPEAHNEETCARAAFKRFEQQDSRYCGWLGCGRGSTRMLDAECGVDRGWEPVDSDSARAQNRRGCGFRENGMRYRQQGGRSARKQRARERSAQSRLRAGCARRHSHCYRHAHGAMMRSAPPATNREKHILTDREPCCQRSEEEEQGQIDCEALPHLGSLYNS